MNMAIPRLWRFCAPIAALTLVPIAVQGQASQFQGMWSDPPATAMDYFCSGACTDSGLAYLTTLLDDPKNDERPFSELNAEASRHQIEEYFRPRLRPDIAANFPLDPALDPGFLHCEPWGVARQILSRHQIEFQFRGDVLELRYGEWDARRTVYLGDSKPPIALEPSLMGYSVAHFEGDDLVIETTGIDANLTRWLAPHSDQLRITERYRRSSDGQRLFLTATYDDPLNQRETITMKKIWGWAPSEEIYPYVDCKIPDEYREESHD